jgi:hypothetical protein
MWKVILWNVMLFVLSLSASIKTTTQKPESQNRVTDELVVLNAQRWIYGLQATLRDTWISTRLR